MSSTADMPVQTMRLPQMAKRLADALAIWAWDERDQFALWAPVMLGLGIFGYFVLPWADQRWAFAGAALALILLAPLAAGRGARTLAWTGMLIGLGLGVATMRSQSVAAARLLETATVDLTGGIVSVEDRGGKAQWRLVIAPDNRALPPRVRIAAPNNDIDDARMLQPGARLALRARLSPPALPAYPGGYDFARNAWFDRIGATGNALGMVRITQRAPLASGLLGHLALWRARLDQSLQAAMPGTSGAIAAALVTGNQGMISPVVASSMRDAGLAHLLSISGLHIAIVVSGTLWLVRRVLLLSSWIGLHWRVKLIAAACAALTGMAYTLIAGSEVPAVRACIATLVVLVGISVGREALTLRTVATAALLILLLRPEALLTPSFQLSFASVTGLVAFYQSALGQKLHHSSAIDGWLIRASRAIIALMLTGLVAEALLSATALFHFNRTGIYGVIANMIAIPLTGFVIMPLLVLALLLTPLGLAMPAYWLLGRAIDALTAIAALVAHWPGAVLRLPMIGSPAYALLVIGGLWLCLWVSRWRWLGLIPIAGGVLFGVGASPPDLLVSGDGRHVAVLTQERDLAMLRTRGGMFLRKSWSDATAAEAVLPIADLPGALCSKDACIVSLPFDGGETRLLAMLTQKPLQFAQFAGPCTTADIVISAQRLPQWCAPHWIRLDRSVLHATDAMAIWLRERRIETVAARIGDHPWQRPDMADPSRPSGQL